MSAKGPQTVGSQSRTSQELGYCNTGIGQESKGGEIYGTTGDQPRVDVDTPGSIRPIPGRTIQGGIHILLQYLP